MPFIIGLASLVMLAVLFGPQWWVRHVLARHGAERTDLPGTGGELARHLLDEAGLRAVKVELSGDGDHYDPDERAVRLLPQHYDGRSVAAVAVAAHEVSHALQHARGEQSFTRRFELVRKLIWIERLANGILLLAP
jgi:Zn-dependent membrane protease YugP